MPRRFDSDGADPPAHEEQLRDHGVEPIALEGHFPRTRRHGHDAATVWQSGEDAATSAASKRLTRPRSSAVRREPAGTRPSVPRRARPADEPESARRGRETGRIERTTREQRCKNSR